MTQRKCDICKRKHDGGHFKPLGMSDVTVHLTQSVEDLREEIHKRMCEGKLGEGYRG